MAGKPNNLRKAKARPRIAGPNFMSFNEVTVAEGSKRRRQSGPRVAKSASDDLPLKFEGPEGPDLRKRLLTTELPARAIEALNSYSIPDDYPDLEHLMD
ncbi:hypothetical protein ACFOGJ_02775 [Marinibaculum pumilum]|uniref:Uncharacterized protein n=1 Tax=Marinibaculum pumilum TaxID=1766165 RepID=A0ABV7KUT0_9PROT